jgi:flagellar motor switch protein FliM
MQPQEILSSEEMSALVPENKTGGADNNRDKRTQILPYNFRRPDRLSKEQIRSLYLLHDLLAHGLSSSLPLFLRAACEVNLISVEQKPFGEYMRGLPEPANIFSLEVDSLPGAFAIEINSSISFPIVDRMLGGDGKEMKEMRAATELELKILESFLTIVLDNYKEAWEPILNFETRIVGRETRPQLLQIVAPNEVVAVIVYQIQVGDAQGSISFCLPVMMLESVLEKFNPSTYSSNKETAPEETFALLKKLSNVDFLVAAELEEVPVSVADLMDLSVGDVLRTNHRTEKPLGTTIGGTLKFGGKIVAKEGRMLIQITETKQEKAAEISA